MPRNLLFKGAYYISNLILPEEKMRFLTAILMFGAASTTTPALAQDPVEWSATQVKAGKVPAGSTVQVKLTAKIEDGWHIYSVTQPAGGPFPTKITVPTGQAFTVSGAIKSTTPEVKFDESFGMDVEYHEGE